MITGDLLGQVTSVVEQYLGPAADRFVKRQILFHLAKNPEDIEKYDLPELTEWIKISMSFVTEDKTAINNCEAEILKLVR